MATLKRIIAFEENGSQIFRREEDYTGSTLLTIDEEPIPDSTTDFEIPFAFDVANVQAFLIVASVAMTIETNSGSAADDTLTLAAGVEYEWTPDSENDFLLDTDVTALFVTNASGAAGTLTCRVLVDPSP